VAFGLEVARVVYFLPVVPFIDHDPVGLGLSDDLLFLVVRQMDAIRILAEGSDQVLIPRLGAHVLIDRINTRLCAVAVAELRSGSH
jgi:hypothetical protein